MTHSRQNSVAVDHFADFFSDETKSIRNGENHYKLNNVEPLSHQQGVLRGEVHTSTKKKVYKVMVS